VPSEFIGSGTKGKEEAPCQQCKQKSFRV